MARPPRAATEPPLLPGTAPAVPAAPVRRYLTMQDVARASGVHPTTVSLALRDHPSIPPVTRSRIRTIARDLGYCRDPLLDAFNFHRLRKHARVRTLSMAFVVDARTGRLFKGQPYHPQVFEGARSVAQRLNFAFEAFVVGDGHLPPQRLRKILTSRGVTGILLSTFDVETPSPDLDWADYCAVKIESLHLGPHLDAFSNNQCQATRLALRRLRQLGYRRIGLATAREDEQRLQESFCTGLLVGQAELPPEERVTPLLFRLEDRPRLPELLRDWVREQSVDVIISNWHELVGCLDTARLRVPRDVAFASLDAFYCGPHVAGVMQNHQLVGSLAMEQLAILAETYRRGLPANPSVTYVPGHWRTGATAPPRE